MREVTLADVAEYAGVSASTASRALNGRGELSPATRAAVLEAADALHFEPSHLARSLRTRTTSTIGFVVPDVSSPFYASALQGAQHVLEQAGYRVLLMDSDSGLDGAGEGTVLLDNTAGIELLVEHLVAHGHGRIALLTGSLRETSGLERLRTFHAAMRRHDLETPDACVAGGRWTVENGRDATRRILSTAEPPTALISSSVELALGALQACRELGIGIPDALALATFDDAYFAELLDPPLTAVGYDPSDVGAQAASLLVEAIREDGAQPRRVTIPVTLLTRRSCGCAQ